MSPASDGGFFIYEKIEGKIEGKSIQKALYV